MSKGDMTRQAILDRAVELASTVGLGGLTIGSLADDLRLSKSGLFGHFRSKEALQVQVLEHAAGRFIEAVVRPSLRAPRGEPRLRALFGHWLAWDMSSPMPGGCIFVAAATELDDRPGAVRERLVSLQREWMATIARVLRAGVESGVFAREADPEQFAQDLYGIMLGLHHASRLLGDPEAEARARRSFERLLDTVRPQPAGVLA